MIAVFYGKDEFRAREALDALRRELDVDGTLADNTERIDGAGARPDELLARCQTLPFLASRRLIVVHGLLSRFEPERGRRRRAQEPPLGPWQGFVDGLAALPETTALVFLDGELSKTNPLLRALTDLAKQLENGRGRVEEFPALRQGEVATWIRQRAQRHGLSLEARAVATLAGLIGSQLAILDSELQKLAAYANGETVTEEMVRSLVSSAREPSVFALADAVVEGRARDALDLLERLLVEGEPPQRLLVMIARQYRLLLQTKELLAQGARAPEISARLGMQHFVMERLLKQAPAHTVDRLRRAYRRLLEADLSVKRGVFDDETALRLLIVELSHLAGRGQPRPAYSSR